jgi:hypothetical protein
MGTRQARLCLAQSILPGLLAFLRCIPCSLDRRLRQPREGLRPSRFWRDGFGHVAHRSPATRLIRSQQVCSTNPWWGSLLRARLSVCRAFVRTVVHAFLWMICGMCFANVIPVLSTVLVGEYVTMIGFPLRHPRPPEVPGFARIIT